MPSQKSERFIIANFLLLLGSPIYFSTRNSMHDVVCALSDRVLKIASSFFVFYQTINLNVLKSTSVSALLQAHLAPASSKNAFH